MSVSVREMNASDIELIVSYFTSADSKYLNGMGADKNKLPAKESWISKLKTELNKPIIEKEIYYIFWLINNKPIGHSNINKIEFNNTAAMHLHIWDDENRRNGNGLKLLKETIPHYFEKFQLKKLICEPYANNPAPIKVLEAIGFEYIETYKGIPGSICFYQPIKRYELLEDNFVEALRSV